MSTSDNPPDRATTNQVRQILMNELGLTRASVREIALKIVATEVERYTQRLFEQGTIERMVQSEFKRVAKERGLESNVVAKKISEAAEREAAKWVRENVRLRSVTEKTP